ncbi:ester cyclase [Rapidithrix thailandica]|uniref:Ester cyclase n=1 Tax=Rapidithrix thailandica TaxID=413964 RepID=A0AAW9S405_9BACT
MRTLTTRILILLALMWSSGISNAQKRNQNNHSKKKIMLTTEARNKAVVRDLYERVLNKRDFTKLQDLISEIYTGPNGNKGAEGFMTPIKELLRAFPNAQWKIESLIGEGNQVVAIQELVGTHQETFKNIPATGKSISNQGIFVYELQNGKIINNRFLTNRIGFLQQLEALPPDDALLSDKNDQVCFIDKFQIPVKAVDEFIERMNINRQFIKHLPGFIDDAVYSNTDTEGNMTLITVAKWKNKEALQKAKEAVHANYVKEGFNPQELMNRLNITMERGTYQTTPLP